MDSAKDREGELEWRVEGGGWRVGANLNPSEGDFFSLLGDNERATRALVIQHSSGLEDLQILVANIPDGGNDP